MMTQVGRVYKRILHWVDRKNEFNSSYPGQNWLSFWQTTISNAFFLHEIDRIQIQISLKLITKSPVDN